MVIEIMGNKVGWLTLYAGVAGGADVVLLPEIPYKLVHVTEAIERRVKAGKLFSIIAVAEGAMDQEEAVMKKKDRAAHIARLPNPSVGHRLASMIQAMTHLETRAVVPGHLQRGGSPSAYDRVLSTQFGERAAQLIRDGQYGVTVARSGDGVTVNPLSDVAGKTKFVPVDHQMVATARSIGITFGDA